MSKYIKKFNEHSEYEGFIQTEEFIKPNVSYCKLQEEVHYNPRPLPPNTNGHAYVDLGLPSGTLWATMNVGAASETDIGLYFSWGETQGYTALQVGTDKNFTWNDYELSTNGTSQQYNFNKYCSNRQYGYNKFTDYIFRLELSDDATYANWEGDWHIPTKNNFQELISNTTVTWDSVKKGYNFTATNGNNLFMPVTGYCSDGRVLDTDQSCNYWTSSLDDSNCVKSMNLAFTNNNVNLTSVNRCYGLSIRGIILPRKRLSEIEKILRNVIPSIYKDEYINSIMKKVGNYYYLDKYNTDYEDDRNFEKSCYIAYYNEIIENSGYNACAF